MNDIAVLIPAFNEEKTIEKVIEDFYSFLTENSSIYVYDNNSSDNTFEVAKNTNKCIVVKEYNIGKGNVVRSMFNDIEANIYMLW